MGAASLTSLNGIGFSCLNLFLRALVAGMSDCLATSSSFLPLCFFLATCFGTGTSTASSEILGSMTASRPVAERRLLLGRCQDRSHCACCESDFEAIRARQEFLGGQGAAHALHAELEYSGGSITMEVLVLYEFQLCHTHSDSPLHTDLSVAWSRVPFRHAPHGQHGL